MEPANFTSEAFQPRPGQIALGASLSVVIFISVGGNILVCTAVCRDRHLRKVNNSLYVSLAIADLLLSVLVMPFGVAQEITESWDFLPHFCNVWLSLDVMCCTASILNICAIALDRYMHVRDPFRYATRMTKPTFVVLIAAIWLCSVVISFLPIHLGWHMDFGTEEFQENVTLCFLELNPSYAVLSSSVSFFIPCLVLFVLYAKLYKHARQHALSIKLSKHSVIDLKTPPMSPSKDDTTQLTRRGSHSRKVRRWSASDHKAAVTLGVIMGTFIICWMPFFVVNVIKTICQCVSLTLFNVVTWLGYFNSCMNPIIYTLFNLEFRNAFKRILCQLLTICCILPSNHGNSSRPVSYSTGQRMHRYSPVLRRQASPAQMPLLPLTEISSVCLSAQYEVQSEVHTPSTPKNLKFASKEPCEQFFMPVSSIGLVDSESSFP